MLKNRSENKKQYFEIALEQKNHFTTESWVEIMTFQSKSSSSSAGDGTSTSTLLALDLVTRLCKKARYLNSGLCGLEAGFLTTLFLTTLTVFPSEFVYVFKTSVGDSVCLSAYGWKFG